MRIKYLALRNFKGYKDLQLELPEGRGLFLLRGKNRDAALGGNASGKSTVWDAVTWILYGRTVRGLKAGDVRRWNSSKGVVGNLVFKNGTGDEYSGVTRTWKPNKLTLNHKEVTQEELEAHLGLSYDAFLHSVLMGQFNPFFFDLSTADKLSLFDSILDLGKWDGWSDAAAAKQRSYEIIIEDIQLRKAGNDSALHELKGAKDRAKVARDAFAAGENERRRKVKWAHKEAGGKLEVLRADALTLEKTRGRIILETQAELSRLELARKANVEAGIAMGLERESLEAKRREVNDKAQSFVKLTGAKCSVCGQLVDKKHAQEELKRLGKERHELSMEIVKLDGKIAALESELSENARKTQAVKAKMVEADTLRERIDSMNAKGERLEGERKALERELAALKDQVNPHDSELKEVRRKIGERVKDGLSCHLALIKYNKKLEYAKYWVKGFRDIRLWVVQQTLLELEIKINNALSALGLLDYSIRLAVEKENKTGGIRRGFSVFVQSPHSAGEVPWESWSGGETQRMRIAGAIGLAELILSRAGVPNDLEVWDEPTQHLSELGIFHWRICHLLSGIRTFHNLGMPPHSSCAAFRLIRTR